MRTGYFIILPFSFAAAALSLIFLKNLSFKKKILLSGAIPLIGGIAIGIGFFVASLSGLIFLKDSLPGTIGIIAAAFLMLVFGIIDDRHELSVFAKFLVQIIAASVLIFFGVRTQIVGIGNLLNILASLIWILGITNALNHLDVIDGLAASAGLTAAAAFFIISLLNGNALTAMLSLALAGALSAFLVYNLPPAKVYMGNAGSHFLGFVLAAIALAANYAPLERRVALLSPLLILGLPIFDTAYLILARIKKNHLPFKKSNDHPALKLLALGYSKKKALLFMSGLGVFFSFCGITVSRVSNLWGLIIAAIAILTGLLSFKKISRISA